MNAPLVGIIANPVSARDIRRIIANASNLQTSERVNIILRVLSTLSSLGVPKVMFMPDKAGISSMLLRSLKREKANHFNFPDLEFVDMNVTSTVDDTYVAAREMQKRGVKAIIVLGGDGTHRAVVKELMNGERQGLPSVAICGLSTGTNNAFPEMREPTIAAVAVGLYVTNKLPDAEALTKNKALEVLVDGQVQDVAIVDAVIGSDRYIGSRAIWKPSSLDAVYLTFADPEMIGFSAIGGLLSPVSRSEPSGLAIQLSPEDGAKQFVLAPIAPGMLSPIPLKKYERMSPDSLYPVSLEAGVVALDGEREFIFDATQKVEVRLRQNAFLTVDVARCMKFSAGQGLLSRLVA